MFCLKNDMLPKGDQPKAIEQLSKNFINNIKEQILMGATGTGKTFTVANIINNINLPTLVIVHNKTLALQLYNELKMFFPKNNVEYFISIFDFYTPEAYVSKTDTYIDKSSKSNLEITMMRRRAQNSLLTSKNTIVVASVAAIYGLDDPKSYDKNFYIIKQNQKISRMIIINNLIQIGYFRNDVNKTPGTFSVKGDYIRIFPGWTDEYIISIDLLDDNIKKINKLNTITNNTIESYNEITIFPASNYLINKKHIENVVIKIKEELEKRKKYFKKNNKLVELQRITQKTEQDIETLLEFGYCSGIENYSAIIENRFFKEPPYTLLDYFGDDFLTIVDESHITLPQVKGMYIADHNRKKTLIDYGFRLPSALNNRPLNFNEFINKLQKVIYVSATPGLYETKRTDKLVEQINRPTGLLDPTIEIRKSKGQIEDLINEIKKRIQKNERIFVTTLTITLAEDLAAFFLDNNLKVAYLHNKLKTLERTKILNDLRRGVFDIIVGINLLREGLDIPEVSLIAIMDADKEGFLRDKRSLIQIIGRAARNVNGHIIMYADKITKSMKDAISETNRRRQIQEKFNLENNIIPTTIVKKIPNEKEMNMIYEKIGKLSKWNNLPKKSKEKLIDELHTKMLQESANLNFEKAAEYRNIIMELDVNFNRNKNK